MSLADRLARVNSAVMRHWGEPVTYTHYASGIEVSCDVVIVVETAQFFPGDLPVEEQRFSARVNATDLASAPQVGDLIETAAGRVWRVDLARPDEYGIYRLPLRVVDTAGYEDVYVGDGHGEYERVVIGVEVVQVGV